MKKNIVKLLAIGMLLGGAVIPTTFANNGLLPQITQTQTAQAATDTQAQTVSYDVYKTGTNNKSISSQYFTKTATVTPNGDGTYKVTLTVKIPSLASVDILTMNGQSVTDSATYSKDGGTYMDVSFNVNNLSDLDGTLNSSMKIKVLGLGLMTETADFKFDTSSLKATKPSTDTTKPTTPDPTDPILTDPTGTNGGSSTNTDPSTSVIIGTPVTTDSSSSTATEQDIPYQVLKADPSQGESVSTQFFTGTAKVTPNDDGTYKVTMTMTYPTSFGTEPVTINSINGGSINPEDTKTYSQDDKNYMDFSFNVNSLSDLDSLIPCAMSIDVSNLGFNSDESVNFKFNATSSGVAGTSAVGTTGTTGTTGTGSSTYGSASDWPTSGTQAASTAANPSTTNSTLPQTGNATNSIVLTVIGLAVATMSVVLFKKTSGFKA
jgi:LPXTG-motif cell wall-anchored protein